MSQSGSRSGKRSYGSSGSKQPAAGKTMTSTPYSAEFEQKMIDLGVLPEGYQQTGESEPPEPDNVEEILDALRRSRASLSPSAFSNPEFREFRAKHRRATSESRMMASVIPIIAGPQDPQYHSAWNIPFNQLRKFDKDISVPQPDIAYGAQPDQINLRVRQDLGEYIVPSTDQSRPAAPNFFLECKGSGGRADVAQRQTMYDGAIGARGMFHLQNYGNPAPTYDGNAYTIASSYVDGQLKLYTTHPRQSETRPSRTEYHITQLRSFAMTDTAESFRSGASAYRNARAWTKQQRDQLIANANQTAERMPTETRSFGVTESTRSSSTVVREQWSSDTSEDELAPQYESNSKRRRDHYSQSTGPT